VLDIARFEAITPRRAGDHRCQSHLSRTPAVKCSGDGPRTCLAGHRHPRVLAGCQPVHCHD
jgi:hypothetical protein